MIQDIYPDELVNHYIDLKPLPESSVMFFRNGRLLVHHCAENNELIYPRYCEFPGGPSAVYLFTLAGIQYFLTMDAGETPDGYEWYTMQDVRMLPRNNNNGVFAAYTGWHLWKWYESSRFCGTCGAKNEFDTEERAMKCPVCGNKIYPRINPAVIVGVTNGEKIVLTKYRTGYGHNALIAGFTEIGETLEGTVRREVMEEVGLKVKNIRYYKSQPWGIASDILVGYYCDVDGDESIHIDGSELKYAEWVERQDIVLQPTEDSLTNEMMKRFRDLGYRGTFSSD